MIKVMAPTIFICIKFITFFNLLWHIKKEETLKAVAAKY